MSSGETFITEVAYSVVSGFLLLRIGPLLPWTNKRRRTTAPYGLFLGLTIIIQLLAHISTVVLCLIHAFVPSTKRTFGLAYIFPFIPASLHLLIPITLYAAVLRAVHFKLSVSSPIVTPHKQGWFKFWAWVDWLLVLGLVAAGVLQLLQSGGILGTLNGNFERERSIGAVIHSITFTILSYILYWCCNQINEVILLPDVITSLFTSRLLPIFLIRGSLTIIDSVPPFILNRPIRILRPDIGLAVDGAIWILTCFSLLGVLKPNHNWLTADQVAVRDLPGDDSNEEEGQEEGDEESQQYGQFGRQQQPHGGRQEGVGTERDGCSSVRRAQQEDEQEQEQDVDRQPQGFFGRLFSRTRREPTPAQRKEALLRNERTPLLSDSGHVDGNNGSGGGESSRRSPSRASENVAVLQGEVGTGETITYAQERPLAPAWVVKGIANGKAGKVEDLATRR